MENLLSRAQKQLQDKLPFILYSKPNAGDVVGFFQKEDELYELKNFSESGFVFASFDGEKKYIIPESAAEVIKVRFDPQEIDTKFDYFSEVTEQDQENFQNLVQQAVAEIRKGDLQKVVLSRAEVVLVDYFELFHAFEKLVFLYPATCAYLFYHPKVGMWMGATPEQLVKLRGNQFETISLAGTQKAKDEAAIEWGDKEQEEQKIVTDFLVKKLKPVTENCTVGTPFSVQAGAIWHIKTIVSGQLAENSSIKNVVDLLHPTPAVCGLPSDRAKEFIFQNEKYDRQFYTGFLGELNVAFAGESKTSDLFVNLRCMQIDIQQNADEAQKRTRIQLYMGCGVTKDSIPEKEWEESVNKSSTMKKVFG